MADRAAAIRGLIENHPSAGDGTTGFLRQVCEAVVPILSASGSGVSVMTDDGIRGACAASDPTAEHVDDLQFVLGEGPCLDAFGARRPVLIADLTDRAMTRWPIYSPAAYEGGVRAVFAFPLQIGGARLGVLDVFRERTGPLTADELADAFTITDVAVAALLDRQEDAGARGTADGMAIAVEHRAELFQAQGMVMVQLGVTLSEGMARMRAHAYAADQSLDEVARDVVAGRLRFGQDCS
jgi:hypothetical protein